MNKKYDLNKDFIEKAITSGKSAREISAIYGCCKTLIYLFCRNNKIKWPKLDLIGKKVGWLTVIKKLVSEGTGSRREQYWLCRCSCGTTKKMSTKNINSGKTISCGCYLFSKERSRKNRLWNGCGDIHGKFWNNMKKGAKYRKHSFNITIEYAWNLFELQNKKCALTGTDIKFAISSKGWQRGETTASLDRIDNFKGYEEGNVQWVHKDINLMKQKLSQHQFVKWCNLVTKHKGILNEI